MSNYKCHIAIFISIMYQTVGSSIENFDVSMTCMCRCMSHVHFVCVHVYAVCECVPTHLCMLESSFKYAKLGCLYAVHVHVVCKTKASATMKHVNGWLYMICS